VILSVILWLIGVGGGVVTVTLAGWLATRRVAQMSPLQVLQSVKPNWFALIYLKRTNQEV